VELTGCGTDIGKRTSASSYGYGGHAAAAVAKPAPLDASDIQQCSIQVLIRYGTSEFRDCMTALPGDGTRDWKVSPVGTNRFMTCGCRECLSVETFLADPKRERLTVKGVNATLKGQ
jgi:hypothetical protein